MRVINWVMIAVGGSVGALLRYGVSGLVQDRVAGTFPWGTMAVNLIGCLLMGALAPAMLERARPETRMLILVGLLGAFTTFSTFGFETIKLLNDGQWRQAAAYVVLSNALCVTMAWVGFRMSQWYMGRA